MVKSVSKKHVDLKNNTCYCFHRDCLQPENFADSQICQTCGSNLLLQGRYRALQLIGQGGFGRTFKGIDESQITENYCAIKQFWIEPNSRDRKKAADLFQKEAKRLALLGKHSHIPQLQDYFSESKERYLIQEFMAGENLERKKLWTEREIRQLLANILPLIQFVHNHQIIHRDIKPENIICRHDGSLVLVDFGAAKVVTKEIANKTGTVIGSAAYIAPEQLRGKAVFASDLYSLGVTCIYLLTQVHPFSLYDGNENVWNWREYLTQPVSPELGRILDKAIASAINHRYHSAEEMLLDLRQPSKTRYRGKKILGISAIAVMALLGMRFLISPIAQEVSTPSLSKQLPIATPHSELGGLYGYEEGKVRAFPLENTTVDAKIAGNLSRVEVKQTFVNPNNKPLEAVYQFPLPDDAAVDEMEIRIGDRLIRGVIKKKQEAKQIYQQAKSEGQTAGLLEQQRDNIFTQSVANIQPGQKVEVIIRYSNALHFIGNNYEFAFPLTVASRYGSSTTSSNFNPLGSPAWAADTQKTRSGRDVNLNIEIDAGVTISDVKSPSHAIAVRDTNGTTKVALRNKDTIPNRDLILRYKLAGADTQATVLSQSNKQGGHFATYLIPAVKYNKQQIVPKDVVFLVDTSGSQGGAPIEQSKELMRQFISGLNEDDTFNIINFSDRSSKLSDKPLNNTRENRAKALAYVTQVDANGGTNFMNGIDTVLNFPAAENGRLRSIVLLSDGLIGADEEIIARVRDNLRSGNRLYSFGVGSSTNRFLLDRLAEIGRGTVTILPPDENAVTVAEQFFTEINKPIVTNIEAEWLGEGEAPEIYPRQAPDLFASQPLVLYGRKGDGSSGKLKITGTVAGGKPYEEILDVNFQQVGGNSAIAQLWGRSRIRDLSNQMYGKENPQGIEAITQTALDYNLLSKYTSFVAVSKIIPKKSDKNSASVPEPSEIIGNLLALIFLILLCTKKRWHGLGKIVLSKLRGEGNTF